MDTDLRPILQWLTSLDTAFFFGVAALCFLVAGRCWHRDGLGQTVKVFIGMGVLVLTVNLHSGTIFYWHAVEKGSIPAMYRLYPVLGLSDGTALVSAIYLIRVLAFPLMGWPACVTIWIICALAGVAMHSLG
jgi:hypothetical protein